MFLNRTWLIFILFLFQYNLFSQGCTNLNLQHQADIASPCAKMTMTSRHDLLGRPYLYVAQKEA